jgi:glycosyltransferase involved in cell wall biosynthesis
MKSDSFVSVVLELEQPLSSIGGNLQEIQQELDGNYTDYEVIVVGRGMNTQFTVADSEVLLRIPGIRYIQLSSWVHEEVAWAAALENAIGDFVVLFTQRTDPVRVIHETVAVCKSGYDVVVGVADQRHSLTYRAFRSLSDRILRSIDYCLPRNATSLRCLSRRAVNSVTQTGRLHHQLIMRIQKTGYPQTAYPYELLVQPGRTSWSLFGGIQRMLQLVVFNSSRPLRWISETGLIGSFLAFLIALYSILIHFVRSRVIEGWTTTILFMSALFMLQFFMMSFFGEYLGRLLDERSDRYDYSVVFEKNSLVMVNQDRINVLDSSVSSENNLVQTGRDR